MASTDLCSLTEVRSFLQKQTADTGQDAIISSLITRASLAIMRHTEREFAPTTASAARKFEYDRNGWLDLAPYDLRTLTTIQADTDETATTLTTDEYRLWPYSARDGVYTAVRLQILSPGRAWWRNRELTITGAWGFAAIPEDVKHCAIVTTAIWLRRDVAAFSSTFNMAEDHVERPEFLPHAIARQLDQYKRPVFA